MGTFTSVALSDALSDTPLARRHQLALRGKRVRAQRALPWDSFDRSEYRDAALGLAVDLWSGLASGEYAAIGLFSQIAAGLSFTEAPFDLVYAATEVSTDETRHAELCVRMAKLCGADPARIRIDAERLHANLAPLVDLEELDFVMLFYAAISETLATGLLTECQRRASDRLSRALFTSLLSDEVHHARFGWYYVAHRSPRWTLAERQRLADRVAEHIVGIERDLEGQGRTEGGRGLGARARHLGFEDAARSDRGRHGKRDLARARRGGFRRFAGLGAAPARLGAAWLRAAGVNAVPGLGVLAGPLTHGQRSALERKLALLLDWQLRLNRWPKLGKVPDATAIASLYAHGELAGCAACGEGTAGERLARAFVLAVGDPRAINLARAARGQLVAQVSYPVRARRVSLDAAPRLIAPGAHGVALVTGAGLRALLVPDVARELALDAHGLLAALEHKSGLERRAWRGAGLYVFETECVVARMAGRRSLGASSSPLEASVRWLAARVDSDGAVSFGLDPRAPSDQASGELRHARAAVVILALARHAAGRSARKRALVWLEREIGRGLAGRAIVDWPTEPALVAGTLALAQLAGIDVSQSLRTLARSAAVRAHAWHAGQVALALGRDAPEPLWQACLASLDQEPRAPWIALAAALRGEWETYERIATVLAARIIEQGPHQGGVVSATVPETALTALVAEALAPARLEPLRRARALARAFVEREQLLGDVLPEASDPERVHGAFPLTPVHSFLRSDVTAHAVLALDAGSSPTGVA